MARPIKKGINYFSFDTDFFEDPKIKKLKHKYNSFGITLYINLLTRIYRECGYYIILEEDILIDIAEYLKTDIENIQGAIRYMTDIKLFNEKVITKNILVLTSERIQRTYQASVKSRGKKNPVKVNKMIWLLDEKQTEDYIHID